MQVSVVVPTYSMDRYGVFAECVESLLAQTHEPLEVVIVVDGNEAVYNRARQDFGNIDNVVVHLQPENMGVSASRTTAAEIAQGDVVAMIDDDATAAEDWIEALVRVYQETDAIAVGGPIVPEWVTAEPDFFPAEFYWLVGCTERDFADHMEEVRNVYGSNISFDREAFLAVGGYDLNTGRKGEHHIQAHEAPVGIRIREKFDQGMIYTEEAVVHHKLFDYRGEFRWLVYRAFWQGYSKWVMSLLYEETYGDEGDYLRRLFCRYLPERMKNAVFGPSLKQLKQIVAIGVFTGAVGLGYLYGMMRRDVLREQIDRQ